LFFASHYNIGIENLGGGIRMSQPKSSLALPPNDLGDSWEKAKTEIEQNKLVDFAITALAIGVIVASRGKLTGIAEQLFPRSDMLMDGDFADKVGDSAIGRSRSEFSGMTSLSAARIDGVPGIDSEAARATEIKRLTLLPTKDLNALNAARAAGEESGTLVEGKMYLTAEFPQIIFKITKEGAEAFLDGTSGNRFTDYLRANY
jgi:hypothetical protein